MSKLTVAAITKILKPLFVRERLGTPALASYLLAPNAIPKPVLKSCGGAKATKNDDKKTNLFYTVTVADVPLYLYYYTWKPNPREFDKGGAGIDVLTADGESLGTGELEGSTKITWSLYITPS